jgi:hypothetical protein
MTNPRKSRSHVVYSTDAYQRSPDHIKVQLPQFGHELLSVSSFTTLRSRRAFHQEITPHVPRTTTGTPVITENFSQSIRSPSRKSHVVRKHRRL